MSTEIITQATQLINSGQLAEAKALLEPIIKSDLHNVDAWFLYIKTMPTPKERLEILRICQFHNPDNSKVQQAIQFLEKHLGSENLQSVKKPIPSEAPKPEIQPINQPTNNSPRVNPPPLQQPWYRTDLIYLLFFLFLTPVWSILILTDARQKSAIKGIAGVIAGGYLAFWVIILPLFNSLGPQAADNVNIENFHCNLTPLSPYDGEFSGTVSNVGDSSLQFVQLRGRVEDANGQVIGSNFGFISSDILYPNATSQFDFYVNYPTAQGDKCFISVEDARFAP